MHSQRGRAVWLAILRRPAGTCYNGDMCDTPGQITRRGHVVCRYGGGAVPATGSFYCTNQAGKHRLSTNYRPAQSCHWFNLDRCMASLAWRTDQPDQPFCRPGVCFVSLDGKYLHAELCTETHQCAYRCDFCICRTGRTALSVAAGGYFRYEGFSGNTSFLPVDCRNGDNGDEPADAAASPSAGTAAFSTWGIYARGYEPDGGYFHGICARPGTYVVCLHRNEGI